MNPNFNLMIVVVNASVCGGASVSNLIPLSTLLKTFRWIPYSSKNLPRTHTYTYTHILMKITKTVDSCGKCGKCGKKCDSLAICSILNIFKNIMRHAPNV